jgi:DNA polymerase III delta subunit
MHADAMSKSMNSRAFMKGIKAEAGTRFLFLGEEVAEKEKAASLLATRFTGGSAFLRFHLDQGDIVRAGEELLQQGMFSDRKAAVLYQADALKTKKDIAILEEIIGAGDSILVMLTSSQNSPPASLKKMESSLTAVIFWRMFENELHQHISARLAAESRKITRDALSLITTLTGRDYARVEAAVERLLLSGENEINRETVIAQIADEREVKVFDYIDSLFARRKDALSMLARVLEEGSHELQVLALVAREAEKLARYKALRAGGLDAYAAALKCGATKTAAEGFTQRAEALDDRFVIRVQYAIHRADSALKSSRSASPMGTMLLNPLTELTERILFD